MARRTIRRAGYKAKGHAADPGVNPAAPQPEASAERPAQPNGEDRTAAQPTSKKHPGPWAYASLDPAKLEAAKQRHAEGLRRAAAERKERQRRREEKRAACDQAKPAPHDLKPTSTSTFSQGGVAKILYSVHFMAASFFHESALALDDKEADQYAKVIMEFSAAWGHPELSDKALAALNLGGTMVMIYGPRLVVIARGHRQPKLPPVPPSGNAYSDAARSTQQQAAAPPQQPKPQAAPQVVVKPNGGFVQTAISPFGDQDGMAI